MKETIYFKSNEYTQVAKDNYTLSVLLSKQKVQYAVYDHFNELKYFGALSVDQYTYQLPIPYFFEKTISQLHFNHLVIGVVEEFAVIPEEYFDDSQLSAYLANQLGKDYQADYSYDVLLNPKVRIVYKKDNQLDKQFKDRFPYCKMYNSITPLIQHTVEVYTNSTVVINHFFGEGFDYICLKEGILQMANRYNAKSSSNYMYFLLNAFKHNKTSLDEIKLYFAGLVADEHLELINRYKYPVQHIGFKHDAEFEAYKHFNLSVLAKCA